MPCAASAALRQHAPLVRRIARHTLARLTHNIELDDLVQVGMIALADALQRFDATQGARFETFATARISGAMLDELRRHDWMTRDQRVAYRAYRAAAERLRQSIGRRPRVTEVAAAAGLPLDECWQLQALIASRPVAMDDVQDNEGDGSSNDDEHLGKQGADAAAEQIDAGELIDAVRLDAWVEAAICALPDRERRVIRNVLAGEMRQQEVAAELGVAPCRVSVLQAQAVARIRESVRRMAGG